MESVDGNQYTHDAGDMTWPTVSFSARYSTLYLPRPRWQRQLSWLVRRWRYPLAIKQMHSPYFDAIKKATLETGIDWDAGTLKVTLVNDRELPRT